MKYNIHYLPANKFPPNNILEYARNSWSRTPQGSYHLFIIRKLYPKITEHFRKLGHAKSNFKIISI